MTNDPMDNHKEMWVQSMLEKAREPGNEIPAGMCARSVEQTLRFVYDELMDWRRKAAQCGNNDPVVAFMLGLGEQPDVNQEILEQLRDVNLNLSTLIDVARISAYGH